MMDHKELLKNIGEKIRKARFARGVSMNIALEIRERYGVKLDSSYLSRIERGKAEIPLRTLAAVANYFNLEPAYFLDFKNKANASGTEYIERDPGLVELLIRLRDLLGPDKAQDHLKHLLKDIFRILEAAGPPAQGSSALLQAARPASSRDSQTSSPVKSRSSERDGPRAAGNSS